MVSRGAGRTDLIAVKAGHAKNAPSHRHRSWPACLYGESQGNDSGRSRYATDDRNQKQRRNPCLEGVEWAFRFRDTDRLIQCTALGRQSFLRRIRSIADALFNLHLRGTGHTWHISRRSRTPRVTWLRPHGDSACSNALFLVKQYGASIEINGMASETLDTDDSLVTDRRQMKKRSKSPSNRSWITVFPSE
jgi:hypothetical protein